MRPRAFVSHGTWTVWSQEDERSAFSLESIFAEVGTLAYDAYAMNVSYKIPGEDSLASGRVFIYRRCRSWKGWDKRASKDGPIRVVSYASIAYVS